MPRVSKKERYEMIRFFQDILGPLPRDPDEDPMSIGNKEYFEKLESDLKSGDDGEIGLETCLRYLQDFPNMNFKNPLSKRTLAEYQEISAGTDARLREPTRPIEVLLTTNDRTNYAEYTLLTDYLNLPENAFTKDKMQPFTIDLYEGNDEAVLNRWNKAFSDAYRPLLPPGEENAEGYNFPYDSLGLAAVPVAANMFGSYHEESPHRFPTFSIMIEGMIHRLGAPEPTVFGELRRAKSDKSVGRLVSWLVGHCTPVDAVDVTGTTAFMRASGCNNIRIATWPGIAQTLLDGGANINHQNRQGFTALSLAAASNTLRGEDEARYMASKWLLEHGANPDIPCNSGYTARMNGQYSRRISQLFKDEDKRRAALPPHCAFCLYIPPDDFEPGIEGVADMHILHRDKEPPRTLLMCAICHKAAYCRKECQRGDWKHHKKSCKPVSKAKK